MSGPRGPHKAGEAVWVGRFEVGSPDWHAARARAVGGSEVAAILGLHPWVSAFELWHVKAGTIAPQGGSFKTRLGQILEDGVATLYAEQTGAVLRRTSGLWAHSERPWQVATPDRFVVTRPSTKPVGLVECKTADAGDAWEWAPDGTEIRFDDEVCAIPLHYAVQLLWQLDTFGLSEGALAVLIGAREFRSYSMAWSEADAITARAAVQAFLASLDAGEAPPIDGHSGTYRAVRALHPDLDRGATCDLPRDVAERFHAAVHAMRAAETEWNATRAEVGLAMGTAQTAYAGGLKVAIRKTRGAGIPWVEAARPFPTTLPTDEGADAA